MRRMRRMGGAFCCVWMRGRHILEAFHSSIFILPLVCVLCWCAGAYGCVAEVTNRTLTELPEGTPLAIKKVSNHATD